MTDLKTSYKTVSESIKDFIKSKELPKRGPYSNSRLGMCAFSFKKKYIDKDKRSTKLTRFGRGEGSAFHELAEMDMRMRMSQKQKDWLSVPDTVDFFLESHGEWSMFSAQLTEQLDMFRKKFKTDINNYVGSEEKLGMMLDLTPSSFDECWFRGVIDYLEIDSSNAARVVDYKNYPSIHSDADLADPYSDIGKQLMGYIALTMANYPSIKSAKYEVYYSQFGATRTSLQKNDRGQYVEKYYTRKEVAQWWKQIQREMVSIERRSLDQFKPQPSRKNCQYCPYIHLCDFWEGSSSDLDYVIKAEDDAHRFTDELIVLREREKRISDSLDTYAKEHGLIETKCGEWYGYKKTETVSTDTSEVLKIAKKASGGKSLDEFIKYLGDNKLTMTKGSVDRFVKKLPDDLKKEAEDNAYDTRISTRKGKSF